MMDGEWDYMKEGCKAIGGGYDNEDDQMKESMMEHVT